MAKFRVMKTTLAGNELIHFTLSDVQYELAIKTKETYDLEHISSENGISKYICKKSDRIFFIHDKYKDILLDEKDNVVTETYDQYTVSDILS